MKVLLNRPQMLVVGLLVLGVFILINRLFFLIGTGETIGEATHRNKLGEVEQIMEFKVNGKLYYIPWNSDRGVKEGDILPIRYKMDNPSDARIFTLWGFWMVPVFYSLGIIIVLISYIYSYYSPSQGLLFQIKLKGNANSELQENLNVEGEEGSAEGGALLKK
jgi:hypothetical protein